MRLAPVAIFLCLPLSVGCEALQLRDRTVRQASTLTDVQYNQVLDNLASFAVEPTVMPYYGLTNKGSTTIQQTGSVMGGLNWDYTVLSTLTKFVNHLDKKSLGLTASQQNIDAWNTDAVLDPDRLQLMRCAYQKVLGVGCIDPDIESKLARFFKSQQQLYSALRPGWLGVGTRKDVPHNAVYVGRHKHDVYVWVGPGGVNDLTLFTLAILDIASAAPPPSEEASQSAKIKLHEDRIKLLSDVYKNLADGSAEKIRLLVRLQAELRYLESLYVQGTKDEKRTAFKNALTRNDPVLQAAVANGKDPAQQKLFQKVVDDELTAVHAEKSKEFDNLPSVAEPPILRPRLNYNSFFQAPNVVPAPPGTP